MVVLPCICVDIQYTFAMHNNRFWSKVEKDTGTECWYWVAGRTKAGYGVFYTNRTHVYAHRVSYELENGPIPAGKEIDHTCGCRFCVNPEHLEAVTHQQNVRRAFYKPYCRRGHMLTAENTWERSNGRLICRKCETICRRNRTTLAGG